MDNKNEKISRKTIKKEDSTGKETRKERNKDDQEIKEINRKIDLILDHIGLRI